MTTREIIELTALLVFGGFLFWNYRCRVLSRAEQDHWNSWNGGKALDATDLNKALKQIRTDHLAARPKPKASAFHRALVSLARRAVADLPYFHDRPGPKEPHL
jgi:hypothetical protein